MGEKHKAFVGQEALEINCAHKLAICATSIVYCCARRDEMRDCRDDNQLLRETGYTKSFVGVGGRAPFSLEF